MQSLQEARAVSTSSDLDVLGSSSTWHHLDGEEEKKEKEKHWYHWAASAVRPPKPEALQYILTTDLRPIQFSQANKLIQSKNDKCSYPFNACEQPLSSPSLGKPWPICRVTMIYQDIFHRKHASIYDLIFQKGWQAVTLIDDIVNDLDGLVGGEIS